MKILVFLLILAAALAAAFFLLGDDAPPKAPPVPEAPGPEADVPDNLPDQEPAEARPDVQPEILTGLSGRVVDREGEPIDQATVTAAALLGDVPEYRAVTDDTGSFRIPFPAGDFPVTLNASAEGYGPRQASAVVAEGRVTTVADIVLQPGAAVAGRVFGPGGLAIEGARVSFAVIFEAFNMASPVAGYVPAVTDKGGSYLLGDLPAGKLELTAVAKGYATAKVSSLSVDIADLVQGVDFHLEPEAPLNVRVQSDDGTAIEGATIDPGAEELGGGLYVIHGFKAGPVWVSASHQRFEGASGQATAGGEEIVLTMRLLASVRVMVVEAETGELLEASGFMQWRKGAWMVIGGVERAGPGRALVHGLEWGKTRISVYIPTYARAESDDFLLLKGKPPEVLIRASKLPVVSGVVVDPDGKPVPGASAELGPLEFTPIMSITLGSLYVDRPGVFRGGTDREGNFSIPVPRQERLVLYVVAEGFQWTTGPALDLGERDVRDLRVVLRPGFTVSGTAPMGSLVSVVHGTGRYAGTAWAEDGTFRFTGLPEGKTLLTWRPARAPDDLLAVAQAFAAGKPVEDPRAVVVKLGATETRAELTGESTPGTVRLTVTKKGVPAPGLDCQLRRQVGEDFDIAGRSRSDQAGLAVYKDLPEGIYQITVREGMRALAYRVFDLAPGEEITLTAEAEPGEISAVVLRDGSPDPGSGIFSRAIADPKGRKLAKERVIESAQADGEGVAVIRGVAPGRYQVWAFREKGGVTPAVTVEVTPGGSVNAGTLHLK